MQSIRRNLALLLLAAGGATTSTLSAQTSAPTSPQTSIEASIQASAQTNAALYLTTADPTAPSPKYPTIAELNLQYAAAPIQNPSQVQQQPSSAAPSTPIAAPANPGSNLVDAPSAALERNSEAKAVIAAHNATQLKLQSEYQRNTDCETGTLRGKPCRVSWWRVLSQSFFFLAAQHAGNIAMDSDTRDALTHGSFWGDYAYCVEHYRWSRWKDDDPFGVDYLGHPMMGAVASSIYEQNDPKQRALMYENTQRYWMGRLRAMAYSAAYSAQWKIGPLSEASIGNTGINTYYRPDIGRYTNETGMQDFFITPIGGLAWNVGEDAIDRFILSRVRHGTRNKWLLFAASLTTPGKSAANITRFRATYYRDYDLQTAGAQVR